MGKNIVTNILIDVSNLIFYLSSKLQIASVLWTRGLLHQLNVSLIVNQGVITNREYYIRCSTVLCTLERSGQLGYNTTYVLLVQVQSKMT